MNIFTVLKHCEDQMALAGPDTEISLLMPGSYGNGQKALCDGGPMGRVVEERINGQCLVFFSAQAVKAYIWQLISPEPSPS